MYLFFVLLVILSSYILYWCMSWRVRFSLRHLPTYFQFPFLGSIHHLFGGGETAFLLLKKLSLVIEKKNVPFLMWAGPMPVIILSDPDEIKAVTNAFLDKPVYYNFGRVWLKDGLVTAPANIWKHNVKLLGGTFNRSLVQGFQEVFNSQARLLVDNFKKEADRPSFDVLPFIMYNTLETVCQTVLGIHHVSDNIVTVKYYNALSRTLQLLTKRGFNLFYHSEWIYHLTADYKELRHNISIMHDISDNAIKQKKIEREAILKKKNRESSTDKMSALRGYLDVLLDLSEADPRINEEQIHSEVNTIIFGGQETSANTLFFILLMIGSKPDIQNKLYAELYNIFGDSKRNIETEDLKSMVYGEAVVMETLRLFPPVPVVMRRADRDLKLNSCTIPKGVTCAINIWGAGRSKRLWGPDAEQFIPERWLPPRVPSTTGFIPFSSTRRTCIGRRYAIASIKTMLAHCIRELIFNSEADKLNCKIDIALRPKSGHLIQVKLRNN